MARSAHSRVASIWRDAGRPAEPLSVREQEILRWLNSQLSLREIAGQLFVSHDTVKTHAGTSTASWASRAGSRP
jgi:ATP/maltotriose-dependent transcriptional regulator MalT